MPTTWKTSERVTIRRVRRIEFVRTADPLDVWIAIDCITDWKRVVTRYAETVLDALISNSLDDIINYRSRFHSCYFFLKLSRIEISELGDLACDSLAVIVFPAGPDLSGRIETEQ